MNPGSGLLPSPASTCWVFTWVLGGKLWQCRFITSPPICIVIQDSFLIPASHTGNKSFKSFLEVFFFKFFKNLEKILSLLTYLVLRQWTRGGLIWRKGQRISGEERKRTHYFKTLSYHIKLPQRFRFQNLSIGFHFEVGKLWPIGPNLVCCLFLYGLQIKNISFYISNGYI